MHQNVGTSDRVLRIGLALTLAGTATFAHVSGTLTLILWIGAALMTLTAWAGSCPLYSLCTFSTRPQRLTRGDK